MREALAEYRNFRYCLARERRNSVCKKACRNSARSFAANRNYRCSARPFAEYMSFAATSDCMCNSREQPFLILAAGIEYFLW